MPFELQGHRGARGLRPENTLPSFEFALDVGVDSIETDVHLTADDVPVLFHDAMLDPRICRLIDGDDPQSPLVRSLTLEQLRRFRADGNPDPARFPEQRAIVGPLSAIVARDRNLDAFAIPTLGDLFAMVEAYAGEPGRRAGKTPAQQELARRLIFDLELKRAPFFPETVGDGFTGYDASSLETLVVAEIRQANLLDRCRVRSFDHRAVLAVKRLEPALTTAVLVADTAVVWPGTLARHAGADYFCPEYRFLDADLIHRCRGEKIRVLPWTVNDPVHWQQLLDWRVDGITTDFPDRMPRPA